MTIFFYKGFTGNRKYPRLSFANIWRLGRIQDTKFGTKVSNEMLWNAAKCQGYTFSRFRDIKGKLTGVRVGMGVRLPTQIRVKLFHLMVK